MDDLQQSFIQESTEQLEQFEETLLRLEQTPEDFETINRLFRHAHTIKGAASVIDCEFVVAFTHVVENLLDQLRDGHLKVTPELIALLLHCKDHITALVEVFATGLEAPDAELFGQGQGIIAQLNTFIPSSDKVALSDPLTRDHGLENLGGGIVNNDAWHISIRFGLDVLKQGMDPLGFLEYLSTLGEISHITTLIDTMPAAADMDPENCYLGFEIDFVSSTDKASIERVFDFVRDDSLLHILPPESKLSEYLELIQRLPEDPMRIGEILVMSGALTEAELQECLSLQTNAGNSAASLDIVQDAAPSGPPPIGKILIDKRFVQPAVVEAAANKQSQVNEKKAQEARVIRVQADKLDMLIDLVGELVIAGASGSLMASRHGQADMVEAYSLISRLVEEIRNSALQLRMVQIGEVFNRFHRVVRDTSSELGKEIELIITGAETELDKSVVEKIGDPLMHLVRNAMDHGVETPEVRLAKGKPARGRLALNAYHDSGSIVIEVMDDGGGLDKERILAKAIERGLVTSSHVLHESDIFKLIFEAGFSTAEKLSNLSGRGVGMDVVRSNIEALRGTVEIESQPGQGTTIRIRLPLTLAIIDGFLVGVGKAAYILPLDYVLECMELSAHESVSRDYINLRGEVLPFVRLSALFDMAGGRESRRQNIVVVQCAGQKAGLVVDRLMGEFQTVIKPLGKLFRNLRGIAGSTILGTGEVALILDVPALVKVAAQTSHERRTVALPN